MTDPTMGDRGEELTEETAYAGSHWLAQVDDFLRTKPSAEARDAAVRVTADVLAAVVAGSRFDAYHHTWSTVDLPEGDATVLGAGRTTEAVHAASLNGTAAIAQEIEEGHNTGGHVGAGIVAGAFASAEEYDVDGEMLVDAVAKSYELCTRLEYALFTLKARINEDSPWLIRNPHSTWTTVGPAVATALVAQPSGTHAMDALLLGANRSVVSMFDPYREGPPSRNLTAGASAATGVLVGKLATSGFRGSASTIQRIYEPFETIVEGGFTSRFDELGSRWTITEAYFKPYPSCRYTHPPLDALRDLDADVSPDEVAAIKVETYANAVDMDHRHPTTPTGAKFSIPYVLATYLHRGIPTFDDFSPEAIADPAVQATAECVTLCIDEDFQRRFPEDWGARVTVMYEDGRTESAERRYPRGDYRESIDDASFIDRLEATLDTGISASDSRSTAETLLDVHNRSAREVGDLLMG